jgi:replicative DNA helicase
MLNFKGEFTRFANPEEAYVAPNLGGEFIGSRMNDGDSGPDIDPLGAMSDGDGIAPY